MWMRLAQRLEERPSPTIDVVGEDLASQSPHPPPSLLDRLVERCLDRDAKARLQRTIAAMQKEAAERGLTDKELARLLADES